MRTTRDTLLTLEEWADIAGLPLWHTAQVGGGFSVLNWNHGCSDVIYQKTVTDNISREEIGRAIWNAESLVTQALGYPPAPKYIAGEQISYPKATGFSWNGSMVQPDGRFKSVKTRYKEVRNVGVQTTATIEAGVTITYSDEDGDTIDDTFTLTTTETVASTVVASEIRLYFVAGDQVRGRNNYYEIRPINVTINGDLTVTITGGKYLLVKPNLYERLGPENLNQSESSNFVTTVDVKRVYIDQSQAGTLIWETDECDEPPCSIEINTACFGIRNKAEGHLYPRAATWDSDNSQYVKDDYWPQNRPPDRVVVNYEAGYPRESDGRMHPTLAEAITKLSVSMLTKRPCGCNLASRNFQEWGRYAGEDGKEDRRLIISQHQLESPWGAKNGAVEAWRLVQEFIQWGVVS